VRIAVPALAAAVIAAAAVSLLRDSEVRRSQDEAARGRTDAAVSAALRAHALEPWAASPPLQLALVYEAAGDISSAQRWIADAIASDPADWRIRLAAARIETRAGDADEARLQLERAVELNPRSPLFADLGGATG
jgi:Tfp pilus assembly protein PilF